MLAVVTDTEPTMNVAGLLFMQRAKNAGNDHLEHIGCVDHALNICTKKVAVDPTVVVGPQMEDAPVNTLEVARGLCTTFSKSTQLMDQLLGSQKQMDETTRPLTTMIEAP